MLNHEERERGARCFHQHLAFQVWTPTSEVSYSAMGFSISITSIDKRNLKKEKEIYTI